MSWYLSSVKYFAYGYMCLVHSYSSFGSVYAYYPQFRFCLIYSLALIIFFVLISYSVGSSAPLVFFFLKSHPILQRCARLDAGEDFHSSLSVILLSFGFSDDFFWQCLFRS